MTVICGCRVQHSQHEFKAGPIPALCAACSHTLGAHKAPRRNDEITERITRLLRTYEIADWRIRPDGTGIDLELHLVPPEPGP